MQARVKAGWIDASALEPEVEEGAEDSEDNATGKEAVLTAADVFES